MFVDVSVHYSLTFSVQAPTTGVSFFKRDYFYLKKWVQMRTQQNVGGLRVGEWVGDRRKLVGVVVINTHQAFQ